MKWTTLKCKPLISTAINISITNIIRCKRLQMREYEVDTDANIANFVHLWKPWMFAVAVDEWNGSQFEHLPTVSNWSIWSLKCVDLVLRVFFCNGQGKTSCLATQLFQLLCYHIYCPVSGFKLTPYAWLILPNSYNSFGVFVFSTNRTFLNKIDIEGEFKSHWGQLYFFLKLFKPLDVNIVQKCQIFVENENPDLSDENQFSEKQLDCTTKLDPGAIRKLVSFSVPDWGG